jgi:hypothetical protein
MTALRCFEMNSERSEEIAQIMRLMGPANTGDGGGRRASERAKV